MIRTPLFVFVIPPDPLKLPLNVVFPVFVSVNVPLVRVPAPDNVRSFEPLIVVLLLSV